jgi:hypothetical protein
VKDDAWFVTRDAQELFGEPPTLARIIALILSMRTLGGEVARGRWGTSAAGGSLSEPLAAGDVAVFDCCTACSLTAV